MDHPTQPSVMELVLRALIVLGLVTLSCSENQDALEPEPEAVESSEEFLVELELAHGHAAARDWTAAAAALETALAAGEAHGASEAMLAYSRGALGATKSPELTIDNGMKFVLLPVGTFQMGSGTGSAVADDDETRHEGAVERLVYMGATEVTQAQWSALMDENPSRFVGEDLPVDSVTLDQARAYAAALSKADPDATYRLPSETEWEFACRAGTHTRYHVGSVLTARVANIRDEQTVSGPSGLVATTKESTVAVASYPANPWGLHDMHGNVWEWVDDAYGRYPERSTQEAVPAPGDGFGKFVLRGGAWNFSPEAARCAARMSLTPERSYDCNGFRLVREVTN